MNLSNLTTVSEMCATYELKKGTILWLIKQNKIEKKTLFKKPLNGYIGHLYCKNSLEKAINKYLSKKNKPALDEQEEINVSVPYKVIKKHSSNYVCSVLRKHTKSPLNNKVLKNWNYADWEEFEKLNSI